MNYSVHQLNSMNQDAFVEALGAIFENTPAIAHQTWEHRPFSDLLSLSEQMISIVNDLSLEEKLALIRAHPDLGTKAKMAEASVREQAGVGLDRLSVEEFTRFQSLNQAYRHKFGFPFIIAVKDHTKESILQSFEERLQNDVTQEIERAISEIARIAWFRLEGLVS